MVWRWCLRDAWFLSWWKFPEEGVAAIAAMIDMLRNCWFTLPTGVKLHFLLCYELRNMIVWSLEMRGYRNGERKVRHPGENGENNKNTKHLGHAITPKLWRAKGVFIIFTVFPRMPYFSFSAPTLASPNSKPSYSSTHSTVEIAALSSW